MCRQEKEKVETCDISLPSRDQAWRAAVCKQPNLKAPGPNSLAAFWMKAFPWACDTIRSTIWELVNGDADFPAWFVRGRTVLIPKEV